MPTYLSVVARWSVDRRTIAAVLTAGHAIGRSLRCFDSMPLWRDMNTISQVEVVCEPASGLRKELL